MSTPKNNTAPEKHYEPNGVFKKQPIEILFESMTKEAFIGFCEGNVIKYMARYKEKGGIRDLCKAQDYIEYIKCVEQGLSPIYAQRRNE